MEAKIKKYAEGDIIIAEGTVNPTLFKILTGQVGLFMHYGKPEENALAIMSKGKCFGELGAVCGKPSIYTAVAFSDVAVIMHTGEEIEEFAQNNHHSMMEIVQDMGNLLVVQNQNINMLMNDLQDVVKQLKSGDEKSREEVIRSLDFRLMKLNSSKYYIEIGEKDTQ